LHRTVGTDRHIILDNGLGPTEDPAQGIEQLVESVYCCKLRLREEAAIAFR
jgi:hypothetical protein